MKQIYTLILCTAIVAAAMYGNYYFATHFRTYELNGYMQGSGYVWGRIER